MRYILTHEWSYTPFSSIFFLPFQLVGLLCLALATSVLSLPALTHSGGSLLATDHAVREHNHTSAAAAPSAELEPQATEHTSTAVPSAELKPQAAEYAEKPEGSDEDMETAEVLVFRPLFRYRQIQAERRRRLEERRRKAINPN
jgi:hypothetical protein